MGQCLNHERDSGFVLPPPIDIEDDKPPYITIGGKKIPVTLHPLRNAHLLSQEVPVYVDEEKELVVAFPIGFTLSEGETIGEIEYE